MNKNEEIILRRPTIEEAHFLLPLMEQLGYPQSLESMKNRLKTYLAADKEIVIAEQAGKIIGLIAMVFYDLFIHTHKRCHIEALVVDRHIRAKGIGKKLIQHAELCAVGRGCAIIDLTSGLRRAKEGTYAFYKALGYSNEGERAKAYFRKEL